MTKTLKYLVVKRNLNFTGLKQEDKMLLFQKFCAILKKPNGIYKEQATKIDKRTKKRKSKDKDLYECLIEYCRKTDKDNRQFVFYGIYMLLSLKEYYMLCSLFLLNEIDEEHFNAIDFRPNRCKKQNEKAKRNIEKSLADLKSSIKKKIEEKCKTEITYFNTNIKGEFDNKLFQEVFTNLAYIEEYLPHYKIIKTALKKGVHSFY